MSKSDDREKSRGQQKGTSEISCPADIQGQTIGGVEVGEETSRVCLSNGRHIVVPTDALYPAGGADDE